MNRLRCCVPRSLSSVLQYSPNLYRVPQGWLCKTFRLMNAVIKLNDKPDHHQWYSIFTNYDGNIILPVNTRLCCWFGPWLYLQASSYSLTYSLVKVWKQVWKCPHHFKQAVQYICFLFSFLFYVFSSFYVILIIMSEVNVLTVNVCFSLTHPLVF